jgi:hypothetical protein
MQREDIPRGYCQCGCGGKTVINPHTDRSKNWVKGEPRKYLNGHVNYRSGPDYSVEDRGHTTPCWVWLRKMHWNGYGYVFIGDGRRRGAHIVSYEQHVGPVPDGLELDHLCRVRACVNPDHLEPVTRTENVRRGAGAKLTPELVVEIRRLVGLGTPRMVVARQFGVSATCVSSAADRRSWKDVA